VFDPGLGCVRAGFFFSRYGFTAIIPKETANFCMTVDVAANHAKTIGARKNLRRMRDL
jgi:hypothetical protein